MLFPATQVFYMVSSLQVPCQQGSIVSRVTSYALDDQGGQSSSHSRDKYFHFSIFSRLALGSTQPAIIQRVLGTLNLRVKPEGCEAHHSPPISAEVKEIIDLNIHSPICLYGIVLS
jgi:hypothetical protein